MPKSKLVRPMILLKDVLTLFQKVSRAEEKIKHTKAEKEKFGLERIRCPLCQWTPDRSSRWICWDCEYPEYFSAGCGTSWNTFATRGRCPGCRHQWRWTSCLRCGQWSKHEAWYEKETRQ